MREFINNNDLSFDEGSRNTTIVTLIGYAQHLGWSKEALEEELLTEIEEDSFIQEEIDRLWQYCYNRNYKNFWTTPKAKELYKF